MSSKTVRTIDAYTWDTYTDIVNNSIPLGTPGRDGAFILDSEEVSVLGDGFTLEGRPQTRWDAVGLFDVQADSVTVTLLNGPSAYTSTKNLLYDDPLSDDYPNVVRVVFTDMPLVDPAAYPTASIQVTLVATGRLAHLGFFIAGPQTDLFACLLYGTSTGITDYSRKDRDTFGDITVVERGFSNWVNYQLGYDVSLLEQIRDYLASRRAALTVYIGLESDPETIVLGYYDDFLIPIEYGPVSEGYLKVDSLTYDKPAYWSEYETVWGTYDVDTCDYGSNTKIMELVDQLPPEVVTATIKEKPLLPGETVTWSVVQVTSGNLNSRWGSSVVTTPCGDLSVFQWPDEVPNDQVPTTVKVTATLHGTDGKSYRAIPAYLLIESESCTGSGECLPDPFVVPQWSTGSQSEAGVLSAVDPMVEIPEYSTVPVDNSDAGHRYFWVDLPNDFGNCRIQTTFAFGTAPVYAKLWNPCDPQLPDSSAPYTGEDIFIAVPYEDRDKWTAILVRVDDGSYAGTIERTVTLQVPA